MPVEDAWKGTRLWTILSHRRTDSQEAKLAASCVENLLPNASLVLAENLATTSDFTLHDTGHAERVAARMTEVIPGDVLEQLSAYELMHLLLAAYLHDIGMSPGLDRYRDVRAYLLNPNGAALADARERARLDRWVLGDAESALGNPVEYPLPQQVPRDELIRLADRLAMFYVRTRHNDWSAEYICRNAASSELNELSTHYPSWHEHLESICLSHHWSEELARSDFDPHTVESEGFEATVVHLRYLACVLRVADILECDPKRTPEVLIRHRDVHPRSLQYWQKDHFLVARIGDPDASTQRTVLLDAKPESALIESALRTTIEEIERELRFCNHLLRDITPGHTRRSDELPHRWDLKAIAEKRWPNPDEQPYKFIEGSFTPDARRLLRLFTGTSLYQSKDVAVRELLQNAFDAVKRKIAYQRLAAIEKGEKDPGYSALATQNIIELEIEGDGDRQVLVCRDSGAGMNSDIIEKKLLRSASTKTAEMRHLELKCRRSKIELGSTGQFGLGALSYFMIADKVTIVTRRNTEVAANASEQQDGNAWKFEITDIDSFGELRKVDLALPAGGTEVRLRLKADVQVFDNLEHQEWQVRVGDALERMIGAHDSELNETKSLGDLLVRFLKVNVAYFPCVVRVISGESLRKFNPGWLVSSETDADATLNVCGTVVWDRNGGTTDLQRKPTDWEESEFANLQHVARHEVLEDLVSDADGAPLACYRATITYFESEKYGVSVGYLVSPHYDSYPTMITPEPVVVDTWKGIRSHLSSDPVRRQFDWHYLAPGVSLRIDWLDDRVGELSVDRTYFSLTELGRQARQRIYRTVRARVIETYKRSRGHLSETANALVLGTPPLTRQVRWPFSIGNERADWSTIQEKVVDKSLLPIETWYHALQHRGSPAGVLGPITIATSGENAQPIWFHRIGVSPARIAQIDVDRLLITPVWETPEHARRFGVDVKLHISEFDSRAIIDSCEFPGRWRDLAVVFFADDDHYRLLSSLGRRLWTGGNLSGGVDWQQLTLAMVSRNWDTLLSSPERACQTIWSLLRRMDPQAAFPMATDLRDLMLKLFAKAFGPDHPGKMLAWHQGTQRVHRGAEPVSVLSVVALDGLFSITDTEEIRRYLPDPGEDWRISIGAELSTSWRRQFTNALELSRSPEVLRTFRQRVAARVRA